MTSPPRRRAADHDLELPDFNFGWRSRFIGALFAALGVIGYLADVVPYETKRHALEERTRIEESIRMLRDVVTHNIASQDQLNDELLRDQIRVMSKLGLEKSQRYMR